MEILSKILIGVVGLLVVILVLVLVKYKNKPSHGSDHACSTCPACSACPACTTSAPCPTCAQCPPLVAKQEILDLLQYLPDNFKQGVTKQQIISSVNSQYAILPQDIPKLSIEQIKALTPLQLAIVGLGYMVVFSKMNFTIDQLRMLTPDDIKTIIGSAFFVIYPVGINIQGNPNNGMSNDQITALNNLPTMFQ